MIKIGIFGATGYTGSELVKILSGHPEVEVSFLTSETHKGKSLADVFPGAPEKPLKGMDEVDVDSVDAVFTCLPHTTAMDLIKRLYRPGLKVIDLSADFRFASVKDYHRWYGVQHIAPELLKKSAYGLPELFREEIRTAQIVGNPGCYPTGALLALAPLAREGLLDGGDGGGAEMIIDAKSGVSGAGRKPDPATQFVEVNENLIPYKVGRVHRHVGEIETVLSRIAGLELRVVFTPQLAPFSRGILSTIYVRTRESAANLRDLYTKIYAAEPFVHLLGSGLTAQLAGVRNNNTCLLGVHDVADTPYILITAAIDNLVKGAAGQAVQNFNILFALEETLGLAAMGGKRNVKP